MESVKDAETLTKDLQGTWDHTCFVVCPGERCGTSPDWSRPRNCSAVKDSTSLTTCTIVPYDAAGSLMGMPHPEQTNLEDFEISITTRHGKQETPKRVVTWGSGGMGGKYVDGE